MGNVANIGATLTLDDVKFNQKLDNSERHAMSFTGKVEGAFTKLFKRSPTQRGETAVTSLVGDLTRGDVTGAISSFAARLSGLSLAAGLGVGAAVEAFKAAKEQITKTDEAYKALTKTLASPIPKSSVEALGAEIEKTTTQTKTLEKESSTFWSRLKTAAIKGAPGAFNTATLTNDDPEKVATNEERIREGRARAREAQREQAKLELDIVNNRRVALTMSEKEGQLFEQKLKSQKRFETVQEESGLTKPGRDALSNYKRFVAAKQDDKLSGDIIKDRAKAREGEFQTAKKLLELERADLPAAQKKSLATSIQLTAINERLKSANLPESERNSLTLQKMEKENELREQTKSSRNPFAKGTIAARDWEDQNAPSFGSIAARSKETESASSYGSLAYNAAQRGDMPLAKNPGGDVPSLIQKLIDLTEKVWTEGGTK